MGLREWWNRTKYRLGWEEITPFGECLYNYCKDIIDEKDVYIQAYEDSLKDMWPAEMYPDMEYNRLSAAIAFVIYMNDNFYGWEEEDAEVENQNRGN